MFLRAIVYTYAFIDSLIKYSTASSNGKMLMYHMKVRI